jgi:hypothetical protein
MKRISIAVLAILTGCVTPVTKEEMATADYGPAPVAYQDEIKSYLSLRLNSPKDAVVEFRNEPKQLYQRGTPVRGEQYGWGVCVFINDRNKAGAYDGFYPMSFVLRNEKIVAANGGVDDNVIGATYAREQCERMGSPFKK